MDKSPFRISKSNNKNFKTHEKYKIFEILSVNRVPDVYLMFVSLDVYTNLAKNQRFCRNLWKPMILWKSFTVMDKSSFEILKFQLFQQKITDFFFLKKTETKNDIFWNFGDLLGDIFGTFFGSFLGHFRTPSNLQKVATFSTKKHKSVKEGWLGLL